MSADTAVPNITSSVQPCKEDDTTFGIDCFEKKEPEWLESEMFDGVLRVWHVIGIILSVLLSLTIMICCFVKFRIPRTKQEIEADYIRKKLTKSFRLELAKINDKDVEDMDLIRALDRVREMSDAATNEGMMHIEENEKVFNEK